MTRAFQWVREHLTFFGIVFGIFAIGECCLFCLCCFLICVVKQKAKNAEKRWAAGGGKGGKLSDAHAMDQVGRTGLSDALGFPATFSAQIPRQTVVDMSNTSPRWALADGRAPGQTYHELQAGGNAERASRASLQHEQHARSAPPPMPADDDWDEVEGVDNGYFDNELYNQKAMQGLGSVQPPGPPPPVRSARPKSLRMCVPRRGVLLSALQA